MKKIRIVATCTIPALLLFMGVYYYKAMKWQLNMAFLEPERWHNSRFVAPDAVIETSTRVAYFVMWQIPLIAGITALIFALNALLLLRKGVLFELRMARTLSWLGVASVASSGTHLVSAAFSPMVLSLHNPDGPAPLRFWYSSTHFALIFYGVAFLMMGWVLSEAIKIDRENKEFV